MNSRSLTIFASFPTTPLTDYLPNGDGLMAYQIIDRLAERGHRLHVVTPRAELQKPISDRVNIYEMNGRNDQARPSAFAYMRWTRRMLREVSRTDHVDLIHELNPVFSFCSLAFKDSGIPVVLGPHSSRWPHGNGGRTQLLPAVRQRAKQLLKNLSLHGQHRSADAILLSTIAALNNVRTPEDLVGKLFILPPGVDIDHFSPSPEAEIEPSMILFLANISTRKGIFSLLDAFSFLATLMPGVKMVIGGEGPELGAVKERVASSSFSKRVEFLGRVSRAEVPELMRRCSIYCLPSHGEPFGISAIEAMSCGKPLVVTYAGGLGHIISNAGGRRVQVGNPRALAEALEELLSQPTLRRQMGEHNRREVERTYAWPVVAARLERVYLQVLGRQTEHNTDRVTQQDIHGYRRLLAEDSAANPLRDINPANAGVRI